MSTRTILQLPQATSLTGAELLELVQSNASVRASIEQILALAPFIVPTGPTGVIDAIPVAGANNNYTASGLFGATTGLLLLTPASASNITGLLAGFDGQIVIIMNLASVALTLNAINSGSLSANQFQMGADQILTQNNSRTFKYFAAISKWVSLT